MDTVVWLALMIVFLIVESVTVVMVSLWFAAGSLAAMVASLFGASVPFQIALFLIVSAVLLSCLRGIVKKHFTPKLERTNIDSIIGTRGYVCTDIDNVSATGTVKLGSMEWTARSSSGMPLPKGTLVKVDKIEGVKVFVTPAEAEVSV